MRDKAIDLLASYEESTRGVGYPGKFGLDVPDDASFARNSPGRSLTLAPGAVVGATRPIAGRRAARGKTGSLRSRHLVDDRLQLGALRHPGRQPVDGSEATR